MILTIRTEKPESELSILSPDGNLVDEIIWPAHKLLSVTILEKIKTLLDSNGLDWQDITGLVAYEGPGSFTGLRIGITVANTIAYSQTIPIVGATGEEWIAIGVAKLENAELGQYITPVYGGEANITKPRK